jgi:hypothetical protein
LQLGIDDPRAWLDATPDDVVGLWDAFYRLEPWGGEYQRHADQMEIAEAAFALQANMAIPKNRQDLKFKPRQRKRFFPANYAGELPVDNKPKENAVDQCQKFISSTLSQRKK